MTRAGHRADRRGRLDHRRDRGRGRADRPAADRRNPSAPPPTSRPQAARPRTDHRGSAEYKRHMVHTFVERILTNPRPGRTAASRSGKGGLTMTMVYDDRGDEAASDVPVRRIKFTINGEKKIAEVEPRLLLAHLIRQGVGLTGTHMGCDTTNCGACTVLVDGQAVKSCTMLAVQVDGRRDRDRRRAGRRQRAAPAAGGVPGGARPAVRLLHARHDDGRQGSAGRQPGPDRGRSALGPVGQPVPVHRLPEHRQIRPVGSGEAPRAGAAATVPAEKGSRDVAGTRRDQDRRAGRQPQARGGQPVHPRQGQLHR